MNNVECSLNIYVRIVKMLKMLDLVAMVEMLAKLMHQTPYFSFKRQLFLCAVFQSFFLNPPILYHIAHTFGPAQEVSL